MTPQPESERETRRDLGELSDRHAEFDRRLRELRRLARRVPTEKDVASEVTLIREGLRDLAADSLDLHRQILRLVSLTRSSPGPSPRGGVERLVRGAARRAWHLLRRLRHYLLHRDRDFSFTALSREAVLRPAFPVPALRVVASTDEPKSGSGALERQTLARAGEIRELRWEPDRHGAGSGEELPPFVYLSSAASDDILPPVALELAVLELLVEELLFVELQLFDGAGVRLIGNDGGKAGAGRFVVRAEVFSPIEGIDWRRLVEVARREHRAVVGKAIRLTAMDGGPVARRAPGPTGAPPEGSTEMTEVGRWVAESYFVYFGPRARPLRSAVPSHRLAPPPFPEPAPEALLLLPAMSDCEAGELLFTSLIRLAPRERLAVALLEPRSAFGLAMVTAQREVTPWIYPLGDLPPRELLALRLTYLMRRFDSPPVVCPLGFAGAAGDQALLDLGRELSELDAGVDLRCLVAGGRRSGTADLDGVALRSETLIPAVDVEEYDPLRVTPDARRRLRRELGVEEDEVLVLMATTLLAERRPEDFVNAALRLREDRRFRFVVAGDGPLASGVDELVRFFGLSNTCRVRSVASRAELVAAADVVCSTAQHEPIPLAILAALAMERPVVVTPDVPLSSAVMETGSGLVLERTGEPTELVEALERLVTPGERARLASGRRHVIAHHDLEASVAALGRLLEIPPSEQEAAR